MLYMIIYGRNILYVDFKPIIFFQLEEMEEEAGVAPASYRNSMMSRIRSYRRDFDKLKRDLVRIVVPWISVLANFPLKCKKAFFIFMT